MTIYLLFIFLILSIIPVKFRYSKFLFAAIMISIFCYIFVGNNNSADQFAYKTLYYDSHYFQVEKGYLLLSYIFSSNGIKYETFKLCIMLICLALNLSASKKIVKSINLTLVLLLWGLTSYWFDIEQSRFFIASSIIAFSTKYLDKGRKGIVFFLILIMLSFSIHTSSIFYISLVLVKLPIKKIRFLALFSLVLTLFLSIMGNTVFIIIGDVLYTIIPNERILMWFNLNTNFGWLGPIGLLILIHLVLDYGRINIISRNINQIPQNITKFYNLMYKISLVLFVSSPIYLVSTEFIRLIRGLFLLFFQCFSLLFTYSNKKSKKIVFLSMIVFVLFFNIQGLNGILFFNNYFVEYMILRNDLNNGLSLHYLYIPLLVSCLYLFIVGGKNEKQIERKHLI